MFVHKIMFEIIFATRNYVINNICVYKQLIYYFTCSWIYNVHVCSKVAITMCAMQLVRKCASVSQIICNNACSFSISQCAIEIVGKRDCRQRDCRQRNCKQMAPCCINVLLMNSSFKFIKSS